MKCDELKVYHCNEWHNEYTEFYLKHEADKVIAEKDDEIAELKEFVQDAEYFKNLAESYHKRWLNAKKELDAYKVKEEQNEV